MLNPVTARISIKDVDSELTLLQFHCCAHTLQMGTIEAKTNGFCDKILSNVIEPQYVVNYKFHIESITI